MLKSFAGHKLPLLHLTTLTSGHFSDFWDFIQVLGLLTHLDITFPEIRLFLRLPRLLLLIIVSFCPFLHSLLVLKEIFVSSYLRERESHTAHLKSIEAELDMQVARVEMAVKERVTKSHEEEMRQLQEKTENEMEQLQSQLKIFQKVQFIWD